MRLALCAVLVAVLTGCSGVTAAPEHTGAAAARVTATVAYRERVALAPTAVIKVQLVDVSRADAPAVILAEQAIVAGGRSPPFAFELPYDPAKIEPRHTYAVQARIEEDGRLRFTNDTRYAVITRGAPTSVEMILKAVSGPAPR